MTSPPSGQSGALMAEAPPFMLAEPVVLRLPMPPSVNALFANNKRGRGKGRFVTDEYETWMKNAGWELKVQRPAKIKGPVRVSVFLEQPQRKRDLDNTFKPLLDLLVTHQVIEADDNTIVKKVGAEWCPITKGCRVEVEAA